MSGHKFQKVLIANNIGALWDVYAADPGNLTTLGAWLGILAFSLQMQVAANNAYPGFTRRIYLRGYRYNMHFMPKTLLVEAGAQTNTVEEMRNAMEVLADLLHTVLVG